MIATTSSAVSAAVPSADPSRSSAGRNTTSSATPEARAATAALAGATPRNNNAAATAGGTAARSGFKAPERGSRDGGEHAEAEHRRLRGRKDRDRHLIGRRRNEVEATRHR